MSRVCSACGMENIDSDRFCRSCRKALSPAAGTTRLSFLDNRYEILSSIKSGAMGAVYKARDNRLDSIVAVKKMLSTFTAPEEIRYAEERFREEAQLLSRLHHGGLPKVVDFFIEKDPESPAPSHYLVMTFIEGRDLEAIISERQGKPFPVAEALSYFSQIVDILDYLHSHNPPVIYRDLNPRNIMIDKGKVYLVDFGIARIFSPHQKGTAIGTPGYAPPEQYKGFSEPRSDLYSLGAIMHYLLTDVNPEASSENLFSFEPVRKLNPQVPSWLEEIIMSLVDIIPDKRPPSARKVQELLGRKPDKPDSNGKEAPPDYACKLNHHALIQLPTSHSGEQERVCKKERILRSKHTSSQPAPTFSSILTLIIPLAAVLLAALFIIGDHYFRSRQKCYRQNVEHAENFLKAREFEKAGDAVNSALAIYPKDRKAHDLLAEISLLHGKKSFSDGKYKEAQQKFQTLLRLEPSSAEGKKYLEITEKKLQILELIARGDRLFGSRDFKSALSAYEEALKLEPGNSLLLKRRKQVQQGPLFKKLIDKTSAEMNKKNFELAMKIIEEALKIAPDDKQAREIHAKAGVNSASAFLSRGDYRKAYQLSLNVLKDAPADRKAREICDRSKISLIKKSLGEVKELYSSRQLDASRKSVKTVMAVDPENTEAKKYLSDIDERIVLRDRKLSDGNAFLTSGDYDSAIACYNEGIEIDNGSDVLRGALSQAKSKIRQDRSKTSAGGDMPSRAYLIDHSVRWITKTNPEETISKYCSPLYPEEWGKIKAIDGNYLTVRGSNLNRGYHVFCFQNKGSMMLTWAGYATGNGQIFLSIWNGSEWSPSRKAYSELIRVHSPVQYSEAVNVSGPTVYVLVNCTSGAIYTDMIQCQSLD